MNASAAVSVKDFVIDISELKTQKTKKKKKPKSSVEPTYDIVIQNNIDFVINRKTATTDKNLVFLVSQSNFYIQDNKSGELKTLSKEVLRAFFQSIYWDKFEDLDKVVWWYGSPEKMIEKMMKIVHDKDMQAMYKHGICVDKYKVDNWKEAFNNNIKLFKYCYNKCKESTVNNGCFDNILKLATIIEQKVNYNNATYFIDKFCESNIKMRLDEGTRYSGFNYETFINLINTYLLDFNRFIEYISFDLYSQGITEFNKNILNEYDDYLRMQISLYGKVKEKYPKYLRTEHDVIALKVNIYEKYKKELMLLNVVDNYKHLIYKDKEYCIVLPESSFDVVDEGVSLSSCVASYVDKIVKNESLILFMRNIGEPDKSLITVEVKDNTIIQAKGFANRLITENEEKFLLKWAKKKDLQYSL